MFEVGDTVRVVVDYLDGFPRGSECTIAALYDNDRDTLAPFPYYILPKTVTAYGDHVAALRAGALPVTAREIEKV